MYIHTHLNDFTNDINTLMSVFRIMLALYMCKYVEINFTSLQCSTLFLPFFHYVCDSYQTLWIFLPVV